MNPHCLVRIWVRALTGTRRRYRETVCGKPAVRYGLCTKHAEDKERLGG